MPSFPRGNYIILFSKSNDFIQALYSQSDNIFIFNLIRCRMQMCISPSYQLYYTSSWLTHYVVSWATFLLLLALDKDRNLVYCCFSLWLQISYLSYAHDLILQKNIKMCENAVQLYNTWMSIVVSEVDKCGLGLCLRLMLKLR